MNGFIRVQINRVQLIAGMVGVVALAICAAGAFTRPEQFFAAYLFGNLFWLGLALGCWGVLMLHHLTGGRWGFPIRRFLEAGTATLLLMILLFVPVFFGLRHLYPWAQPSVVAANEVLLHKRIYLNPPGFIVRTLFFFGVWLLVIYLLNKWSLEQDQTSDAAPTRRLRTLSGPGIVLYPVTATFAYVDWIMSLEPEWYSTIFLVIVMDGIFAIFFASIGM